MTGEELRESISKRFSEASTIFPSLKFIIALKALASGYDGSNVMALSISETEFSNSPQSHNIQPL